MTPYYEKDGIVIYHGDCRDILPQLEPVDLVLTDPPYGIGDIWQGGKGHGWGSADPKKATRNEWDNTASDLDLTLAAGKNIVIWGGNYFPLPPSRCWLVWRKESTGFTLSDAELAWTNQDAVVRVYDHARSKLTGKAADIRHPTEKPIGLIRWCIEQIKGDAQTILDPFMGSGTTLRAAKDLGRKAIGIEIEERYCEIAAKRLAQEVLDLYVEGTTNGNSD
jgi:site-specific DNA-methyltransferase (adenine-specific)